MHFGALVGTAGLRNHLPIWFHEFGFHRELSCSFRADGGYLLQLVTGHTVRGINNQRGLVLRPFSRFWPFGPGGGIG